MTETENLKREALVSKTRQTAKEIENYLDSLIIQIDLCRKRHYRWRYVWIASWLAWVGVSFIGSVEIDYLLALIFFIVSGIDWVHVAAHRHAIGEFEGAVRVLRILELIPPLDENDSKVKRKKTSTNPFTAMVKGWFINKKKAHDAVYAPS